MTNLFTLVKIEFSKALAGLFIRKNNKNKPRPLVFGFLLLALLIVGLSFLYNGMFIWMFQEYGIPVETSIILFAALTSMLTFVSAINQSKSIYIGDDYDLLITLPLKKSDIVASKIITLYTIELMFSLAILIPNGIMLIVLANNVTLMLISFMLAFLIPIVPIAIASLISLDLTLLTARFKHGNIINIVLYTILIASFSVMNFFIGRDNGESLVTIGAIIKWFNPSIILVEMGLSTSYWYLLIFAGANIVLLTITVLIFALLFTKLHELVTSVKMKTKYVRKELKIKNEFKTLFGIEMGRLISSKVYFLNGVMGAIMCVVMTPMMIISTIKVANIPEAKDVFLMSIVPIIIAVMMMILGISNPTAASISMEGKTFWMSKTLPINLKKYMWAKLFMTYVIFIPASLIASTISVIFYHDYVIDIVMIYIIPIISILVFGLIGLICNVKHPKFKWKNETEAVKNSASVGFTMLFGFLITLVLGTVLIAGSFILPLFMGLTVTATKFILYFSTLAVLLIILLICYFHLNAIFEKRIEAMEDL